jgi:hypothetical protein
MEAIEMQNYLKQLHAERALASEGLSADDAYVADLDEEIAVAAAAYVCAAVTEIAILRGELYGRLEG